jgi:hypothetical protein
VKKRPQIHEVLEIGKAIFAFPVASIGLGERGAIYETPCGTKYIVLSSNKDGLYIARPGELVALTKKYEYNLALAERALEVFYAADEDPRH